MLQDTIFTMMKSNVAREPSWDEMPLPVLTLIRDCLLAVSMTQFINFYILLF